MDSSGSVDLTHPGNVVETIDALMVRRFGVEYGKPLIEKAIADLAAAFRGDYPGLLRCDTSYHDLRHALDSGLAMARLIDGFCDADPTGSRWLTADRALFGIILALFHDIGLMRTATETDVLGASLLPVHERRGVGFLDSYLKDTRLGEWASRSELIMVTRLDFTPPDSWPAEDRMLANLVGTADIMSQVSDRCYLEKCRDFLYDEFSAVGLTGQADTMYPDRETLLRKTPGFVRSVLRPRIERLYGEADRFLARHFDGECPYSAAIDRNLDYLEQVLAEDNFGRLRRAPTKVIDGRP